eukprot:1488053-Alexandrium_andersonii.AAC.1
MPAPQSRVGKARRCAAAGGAGATASTGTAAGFARRQSGAGGAGAWPGSGRGGTRARAACRRNSKPAAVQGDR